MVNRPPVIANIDLLNVTSKEDKVKVEIEVTDLSADTISYFLPKIVPGTYQNNDYGKFVEDFTVTNKDGLPLSFIKK